jgi:uncharacterized membrane protein YgcG
MMKKFIFAVLFFACIISAFTLFASAASTESRVDDRIGILTAEQEAEIDRLLADAEAKAGVKFRVITSYRNEYKSESILFQGFPETSYADDVILLDLIIDKYSGEYYYDLYTYGNPNYDISGSEIDRILDGEGVYSNLKEGKYIPGIEAFCALSVKANNGKLRQPLWKTLLISLVIGVLVSAAVCGGVIYKYKRKLKAPSYPLDKYASLELNAALCNEMFIGSFIKKTRISSSGGSGGRRSGGGRRGGR